MKSRKVLRKAMVLGAALTLPMFAQAQDWKVMGEFGWFSVGKSHEIEKGHFYWVGEFSGTFFNDKGQGSLFHRAGVRCPAYFDVDLNNNKGAAAGYCVISDMDGDQAYLTWESRGTPGRIAGPFQYTGGTGKYQGISGRNTFVGVVQVNWQDGMATGYSTWNR